MYTPSLLLTTIDFEIVEMCEANPFIVTIISKFIPDEIKVKTSSIGGKKKKKKKQKAKKTDKKGDSTGEGADRPIVVVTNLGAELRTLYDRLAEKGKESELEYQLMVEGKEMDAINFAFDATGGGDVSMDDKTSTHSMNHIVSLTLLRASTLHAESVILHLSITMNVPHHVSCRGSCLASNDAFAHSSLRSLADPSLRSTRSSGHTLLLTRSVHREIWLCIRQRRRSTGRRYWLR